MRFISLMLVASMTLGGCAAVRDSRVNPFNWFGNSQSEPVAAVDPEEVNPLIPTRAGLFERQRAERERYVGRPIDTVSDLVVERVPGGAIVRATGVARVQGLYSVQLTPDNEDELPEDGVLTYRLEGIAPGQQVVGGSTRTRTHTAARKLTDQDLQGVRVIRVVGVQNARTTRRR